MFKRDKGKCVDCARDWNDGWMLHASHEKHPFEGGNDHLSNGKMRCIDCHQSQHQGAFDNATDPNIRRAHAYAIRKLKQTDRRNIHFYKKKKS